MTTQSLYSQSLLSQAKRPIDFNSNSEPTMLSYNMNSSLYLSDSNRFLSGGGGGRGHQVYRPLAAKHDASSFDAAAAASSGMQMAPGYLKSDGSLSAFTNMYASNKPGKSSFQQV